MKKSNQIEAMKKAQRVIIGLFDNQYHLWLKPLSPDPPEVLHLDHSPQ